MSKNVFRVIEAKRVAIYFSTFLNSSMAVYSSSPEALAGPIKTALLASVQSYGLPVYFDETLTAEMEAPAQLSRVGQRLGLRVIAATLARFIGDLNQQRGMHVGIHLPTISRRCLCLLSNENTRKK